jgi:dolichyl-phosphate beta-glucosyltransferase
MTVARKRAVDAPTAEARKPRVSLVIPTLNEDLAEPLVMLGDYLRGLDEWTFEILFVDDSKDEVRARGQAAIAAAILPPNVQARLVEGAHEGKGSAVGKGIGQTRGDIVFVIDVDLPAPIECVGQFLGILDGDPGVDAVIAERPLGREFTTPVRWLVSRGLLVMQRALVFHSSEFQDTQCGFKAFRGDLIRDIASEQIVIGGMYDLEYLYVALRRGRRVEKVTIVPTPERRQSRINVWKCLRQDPVDVIRIKAHGLLGRYR